MLKYFEIKGLYRGQRSNFQNAPIELKFINNDPYYILSILKCFKNHSTSLRGHKGVKSQVYQDAPMELKIHGNDL